MADDDLQRRLDEALNAAARERDQAEAEMVQETARAQKFILEFRGLRANVIKPAMEKARSPWVARELESAVTLTDRPLGIKLVLVYPAAKRCEISYNVNESTARVECRRRVADAGLSEQLGEYSLEDLSEELVQSHVDELTNSLL